MAGGWGIRSNLSHPGIAPTSLLAARPELGREERASGRGLIGALSTRGILVGTAESAGLPALLAATDRTATGGEFYGPRGFGHIGGAPARQTLYSRLTSAADARRIWDASTKLTSAVF